MQKLIQIMGLFTLSFILYGCPMDSGVPIDHSRAYYIDHNMLGNWKNRADGKIYTITKYDAYTYQVSFNYSDGTRGNYYPFISFVKEQSFLCVPYYDDEMQETRYYLFGLTTSNNGNTWNIRGLKQPYDFYPRSTSELKNWIANNMYSSSFYSSSPDDSYILDRY